jgi:tryptophanyl-tRNA synthetase
MTERILTGITTTGTPHLGNYVGAIRPAIAASRAPGTESFFFLADYHALVKCADPARVARSTLEIAATWLAAGLQPEQVTFYRQSDVPQTTELAWLLTCATAKGQMNRAHAYKAAVDANTALGEEPDAQITMGLFCYPILMAADILLFNAQRVPVGRDQVQHIEMARDVAQRFNHQFGAGRTLLVLPQAEVAEEVATLPGLDGRKMSKSYDNTVPLFEGGARGLQQAVARIVTDSRAPGEPKIVQDSNVVALFDAFANAAQRQQLRADLQAGLGWGEAKQQTVAVIEAQLAPMRDRYAEHMAHPERVEAILQDGAQRARALAAPHLAQLREAVGLRRMALVGASAAPPIPRAALLASFKQYREGAHFFFKLVASDGKVLLQSVGLDDGRSAGMWVQRLKTEGAPALAQAPLAWTADAAELEPALAALLAAQST